VWAIQPASIPIVKDFPEKNHVLLLHLNEKLQKIPAGQLRQGCKAENLNQVQLRQKFFQNRKSIV
jgi:hypothetical protein